MAGHNYTLAAVADIPIESNLTNNMVEASVPTEVRILGDANDDRRVDMRDIGMVAWAFGTQSVDPRWNPACDVNGDGRVDMRDVAIVARNFGRTSA